MAQAFDRLVRRCIAICLVPVVLSGCQYFSRATAPCPEVMDAEAWVNRMPSIGASPAKLIVSLTVSDERAWMLKPAEAEGPGEMSLDLVPGGNSVPGTVAYRQRQPAPLPETIRIMCRGGEIARIDEILIVQ